jgi:uncharacterized membrane protein
MGELIEAIDSIVDGVLGWRYIFSSSYRRETHSRWRIQGRLAAAMDILGSVIGLVFTLLIIGVIVYLIL